MSRLTGNGRTERFTNPNRLLIYNFDIDGDRLKNEHQIFLRREVVPTLRAGGSVTVVGLASRSGSQSHNQPLSMRRAQNTLAFLRTEVPTGFASLPAVAFGELKAARAGLRDGSEDERFRAVAIYLASRINTNVPVPPPPPPPAVDVTPNQAAAQLPQGQTGGVAPTLGSVLDRIGQVTDWTEVGTILTETATGGAEIGALTAAGTLASIVSLIVTPLSILLSVLEAFDEDLKIDQLMGYAYGVVYAARMMDGPTQLPYSASQRRSQAERFARFNAGVRQGRSQIGSNPEEIRRRTAQLRIAIYRHGEHSVLNAIYRRSAELAFRNSAGSIARDFILSFPEVGVEGLRR